MHVILPGCSCCSDSDRSHVEDMEHTAGGQLLSALAMLNTIVIVFIFTANGLPDDLMTEWNENALQYSKVK